MTFGPSVDERGEGSNSEHASVSSEMISESNLSYTEVIDGSCSLVEDSVEILFLFHKRLELVIVIARSLQLQTLNKNLLSCLAPN